MFQLLQLWALKEAVYGIGSRRVSFPAVISAKLSCKLQSNLFNQIQNYENPVGSLFHILLSWHLFAIHLYFLLSFFWRFEFFHGARSFFGWVLRGTPFSYSSRGLSSVVVFFAVDFFQWFSTCSTRFFQSASALCLNFFHMNGENSSERTKLTGRNRLVRSKWSNASYDVRKEEQFWNQPKRQKTWSSGSKKAGSKDPKRDVTNWGASFVHG